MFVGVVAIYPFALVMDVSAHVFSQTIHPNDLRPMLLRQLHYCSDDVVCRYFTPHGDVALVTYEKTTDPIMFTSHHRAICIYGNLTFRFALKVLVWREFG